MTVEPSETPSKNSLLGRLRAQRAAMDEGEHIDLDVPRWTNPPLRVRYGVLEHSFIRGKLGLISKAPKGKKGETELNGNMDLLIKACIGVYAFEDGKEKSLHPEGEDMPWTTFDPDLAATMGVDPELGGSAREVLRAIYFADGDIMSAANEVVKFSGYQANTNDESFLGE